MTYNVLKVHRHKQFLWGASISSYQVEGGTTNNDWDYFTRSGEIKKRISNLTSPSILSKGTSCKILEPANHAVRDGWMDPEYYEIDFENSSKLGFNDSLEWPRIAPEESTWNEEAINHYRKTISFM